MTCVAREQTWFVGMVRMKTLKVYQAPFVATSVTAVSSTIATKRKHVLWTLARQCASIRVTTSTVKKAKCAKLKHVVKFARRQVLTALHAAEHRQSSGVTS